MSHDEKRRLTKEERQAWRDEDALYNNSVYTLVRYINEALDHIDAADEEITMLRRNHNVAVEGTESLLAAISRQAKEIERLYAALRSIRDDDHSDSQSYSTAFSALGGGND